MGKKWIPLEANPDTLNQYAASLGMDVSQHQWVDVFGLDDELLAMVPQPVVAVMLLFPITEETEAARKQEQEEIATRGQEVSPGVYYMKQTIGNACGTIGLLHAVANSRHTLSLAQGSFLDQFLSATEGMTPEQRGAYLEDPPPGAPNIDALHQEAAVRGDTAAPSADEDVDLHFVAFVCRDGCIYELDGRKACPINHGPCSADRLLGGAAAVLRATFLQQAGGSIQFNMMALAAMAREG